MSKPHRTGLAFFCLAILSAVFLSPVFAAPEAPTLEHIAGAYLYNFENDTVLLEHNTEQRVHPTASVKLMTGILAYEALGDSMDDTITVSADMLRRVVGNNIGLSVGEVVTVSDMLHALLVNNANDAAQVLAFAVAGSLEAFVTQMNEKAQYIGAYNTFYTNPTGMHSDAMVTTVADTAVIARYAYSLEGFTDITATPKYVMDATNKSDYRNLFNRNAQLSKYYDTRYFFTGALGMNAGYTEQGGYCLVTVATRDDLSYLAVVMGAEKTDDGLYSYINGNMLLSWAFDNYGYTEILSEKLRVAELPVSLSSTVDHVTLVPAVSLVRYLPRDVNVEEDIHISYNTYSESLTAPVTLGQVCGSVTVTLDGEILGSTELIASNAVTRSEFLYLLARIKAFTGGRFFRATVVFLVIFSIGYVLFEAKQRKKQLRHHHRL